MRGDAEGVSRPDPASGGRAGAGFDRGARAMPGRRAGSRAGGPFHLRRARRRLGQPEIVLGVFAPAASVLLPKRVGQARAEDLLFSGRTVNADEARAIGLVDAVADDPEAAALAWFDRHLAPAPARCAMPSWRRDRRSRGIPAARLGMEELYLSS